MFGLKKEDPSREKRERPPFNPRSRVGLYALCGLYLGYLLYQVAAPYCQGLPSAVSTPQLLLGVVVLGGGMLLLFYLAWRMYRAPVPVEKDAGEDAPLEEPSPDGAGETAPEPGGEDS